MSRMVNKNSRGRKPLLSTPKVAKLKISLDDNYQDSNTKGPNPKRKYAAISKQSNKRKRVPSTPSDTSTSSSDAEDEAAPNDPTEDESESDEDEPLEQAPSLNTLVGQTGRPFRQNEFDDAVSDAGSLSSMFDPNFHFENGDPDLFPMLNVDDEEVLDPDDINDEIYNAVDDISDSDDQDPEAYEELDLLNNLTDDDIGQIEFLNQIDGLSEYGFGDEGDETAHTAPSSVGSDHEQIHQRHVHFHIDPTPGLYSALSSSPTITRALLPSALPENPETLGNRASATMQDPQGTVPDDEYDSDATEVDPAFQVILQEAALTQEPKISPSPALNDEERPRPISKSGSKKSQRRGPPRGIFIDEGTKASGILDPSGKILLITHPHLLGEAFARRYGNSAPASPSVSFREVIDGSDAGDSQLAGENPSTAAAEEGSRLDIQSIPATHPDKLQSTKSQDASTAAEGFEPGDYILDDMASDDGDLGEDVINMDDVIKFDDSDDSDDETSPIYMPPKKDLRRSKASKMPSFASAKVTAFRNNADPNFNPFSTSGYTQLAELGTPMQQRTPHTHKRKRTIDSSYSSSLYAGVTPIQRIRDPNPPASPVTPESSHRPKRSRNSTA